MEGASQEFVDGLLTGIKLVLRPTLSREAVGIDLGLEMVRSPGVLQGSEDEPGRRLGSAASLSLSYFKR